MAVAIVAALVGWATCGGPREDAATRAAPGASVSNSAKSLPGATPLARPPRVRAGTESAPPDSADETVRDEVVERRFVQAQASEYLVLDEDHRPIAGAELTLCANDVKGPPIATARTGTDGRARLVAGRGGEVLVAADGFETVEARSQRTIVLRRGTEIAGVVTDVTGAPIAGARLVLDHPFRSHETQTTRDDGTFRFRGLARTVDRLALHADANGFAPWEQMVDAGDGELRIVLRRGARVSGSVVFADGSPVPNPSVWIERADHSAVASALPAAEGGFVLDRVESGSFVLVAGTHDRPAGVPTSLPRSGRARVPLRVPEGGAITDLRVVLEDVPTSYFRLRFVDAAGQAADPESFVVADFQRRWMWTPKNGDFVGAAIAPAGTALALKLSRSTEGPVPPRTVTVTTSAMPECAAEIVALSDVVAVEGERLTVIARGPQGGELPGDTTVELVLGERWIWKSVAPLERGPDRATWRIAAGVPHLLDVSAPGFAKTRLAIDAGGEREVRLVPAAHVRARVVLADDTVPEDRLMRLVFSRDERTSQWFEFVSRDEAGRLDSAPLPPGACVLRVTGPSGAIELERRFDVEPGAAIDLGTLRLPPVSLYRGRVVDADGHSLGGASASFHASNEGGGCRQQSGPDGTFEIRLPANASGALVVSKQGFGSAVAGVDGVPSEPREFRLGAEGRILVRILHPPPTYSTWVRTPDGLVSWQPATERNDEGRILTGLAPGPVVVVLSAGPERTRAVVVVAGRTVDAVFDE